MNTRLLKQQLLWLLVTLACVSLFVHLGNWQYNKAKVKEQRQFELERGQQQVASELPSSFNDVEAWRYRKVKVEGHYLSPQFLLDNQIRNGVAGYEVLSPLKINGSPRAVLINRGWVEAPADRSQRPVFSTPKGDQSITGLVWLPPKKTFRLGGDDVVNQRPSERVIEQVDMASITQALNAEVLPVVIRLASAEQTGALDVNWPMPNERVTNHMGYAYQWYGFAVATVLIFLSLFVRKLMRGGDGTR